ncbi:MAG TPA: hypothetical protein VG826_07020 [Pirellulales bacterium]|nr:hypothetical protein [Pirellulales bacterium]
MEENPYRRRSTSNTSVDDRVPRWAVATMICLGLLITVPGVVMVLAVIGDWLMSLARAEPA